MGLKIAVPKTTTEGERRVGVSPETVKKLTALGCAVSIEKGAGEGASFTDEMLASACGRLAAAEVSFARCRKAE